jgi:hypothetical protein
VLRLTASAVRYVIRFYLFLQCDVPLSETHKFRKKSRQEQHCSDINLTVLHVLADVEGHYQANSL